MDKSFEISQSGLERARDTNDEAWLATTFAKAEEVIQAGGQVNITQQFSDATTELVAIIDSTELLDYYKEKYSPE